MSSPSTTSRPERLGIAVAVTFDKEALELLRHYSPPLRRGMGHFLGRLIFEHHARMQERKRLLEEQRQAAANGGTHGED
jgi:hypothetical protein